MKKYLNRFSIMKFIFFAINLLLSIYYDNILLGFISGYYFKDLVDYLIFIKDSEKHYKQIMIDKEVIKN